MTGSHDVKNSRVDLNGFNSDSSHGVAADLTAVFLLLKCAKERTRSSQTINSAPQSVRRLFQWVNTVLGKVHAWIIEGLLKGHNGYRASERLFELTVSISCWKTR